ncbi:MAG: hypothetical protein M3Q65_21970 [Chloroflexota bacterium]|nr:hypothetical protein [Chloroflexota bacterium]
MTTVRRLSVGLALTLGLVAFLALTGLASAGDQGAPMAAVRAQQTTGATTIVQTTARTTVNTTAATTVIQTTAATTATTPRTTTATTPRTTTMMTTTTPRTTTATTPAGPPSTGGGGMSEQSSPLLWMVAAGLLALVVTGATYALRGRRI